MPTLKEITDDLYATMNINSDDNNVDERLLKQWVKNKRSILVKQQMSKRTLYSSNLKQSIPCLELELHDKLLSTCCVGLSSGCSVLKSTIQIPKLISYKGRQDLSIRPITVDQIKFNYVTHDAWIRSGNQRFNSNDIYASIIDRYLYVKSNSKVLQAILGKYLFVEGVWEDPEALADINDCNGDACYSDELDYPIDQDMVDIIKQEILRTDLRIILGTPEDKTNDSDTGETQIQNE